ncbi:MAG TPA: sugar transferase, partial [Phycisphaerae bacterium]|nr:sugar transferase [Phycisphaerae bacterium]
IERLYAGVTDVGSISIVCSLVSVAAARCLRRPNYLNLAALRAGLVAACIPTRDVTVSDLVIDLGAEQGLLNLSEHLLTSCPDADLQTTFRQVRPGIWAAPNCRIHPSSKLIGPAVLNKDVTIQARARVVGPAVLDTGVDVGSDAALACCLVGHQAHIPCRSNFANQVVMASTRGAADREPVSWIEQLEAEQTRNELRQAAKPQPTGGRFGRRTYNTAKRVFDFGAALCGLITLAPLLLLVSLMIKLTSHGPVLFGHVRESRGGRAFRCWKFRTMVDRAHAQQRALYAQNAVDGPQFKLQNDPRVTPLGRILRSTNIDEIPQLFNVLRGQMSLVGPRPSPFRENQICVPWREARLSVLPGITGLWQVCRHDRDNGDFHQWIYYDVLYARHRSFAVDLRILLATFLTLGGRWGVPVSWVIPGYQAGWTQRPNADDRSRQDDDRPAARRLAASALAGSGGSNGA